MNHSRRSHRFPTAGIDPIDDAAARLLFDAMRSVPARYETIVVLLDPERRGHSIITVDGTYDGDAVFEVAELAAAVADRCADIGAVVIASVRPGGSDELDDIERWLELDHRFAGATVELVEWYVYGRAVLRPRQLVGAPDRWAA